MNSDVFEYLKKSSTLYLQGHWQLEEYFLDIRNLLLEEFTPAEELSNDSIDLLNEIEHTLSVSLHIRRGDYVNAPNFEPCGLDYYLRSIDYISKQLEQPRYFIFSDDIEWAKSNFKTLKNVQFVAADANRSLCQELWLMSKCKHHIISNSTYSWWGAWLNVSPQKIVVAPKRWYKNDDLEGKLKTIALESWIKL